MQVRVLPAIPKSIFYEGEKNMDIEKEIKKIESAKKGDKEMAFFYIDGNWEFLLGNASASVVLGEANGEIETSGNSLEDVINKMKKELGI